MSDKIEDADVSLVIQDQPRTEIYWGGRGHLIIKQTCSVLTDDGLVFFNPVAVPKLIRCLQEKYDEYAAWDSPVHPAATHQSIAPPTPERMPPKPQKKKGAGS